MAKKLNNILVNYIHDRQLKKLASIYFSGYCIDIGCGEKPYKKLLAPYVSKHIGIDHQKTQHNKSNIDRFGTAYAIPAEDGKFDCALCTAVLNTWKNQKKHCENVTGFCALER